MCPGVWYCSTLCQTKDWPNHKQNCNGGKIEESKKHVKVKPSLSALQKLIQKLTVTANRYSKSGDMHSEGMAYLGLGHAYKNLGRLCNAIDWYQKYLKISLILENRTMEGDAYGNLGNIHRRIGQLENALEFARRSLKIALELGSRVEQGKAYAQYKT
jgi:tetratricopeptide (TPR) repeat protein